MYDLVKLQSAARGILETIASVLAEHGLEARPIRECLNLPHLNGEGFGPGVPATCRFEWHWQNKRARLDVRTTFSNVFPQHGTDAVISVSLIEHGGGMILDWMYGAHREGSLHLNREEGLISIPELVDALRPLHSSGSIETKNHAAAYTAFVKQYLAE